MKSELSGLCNDLTSATIRPPVFRGGGRMAYSAMHPATRSSLSVRTPGVRRSLVAGIQPGASRTAGIAPDHRPQEKGTMSPQAANETSTEQQAPPAADPTAPIADP